MEPKKSLLKRIFAKETGEKIVSEFIDMFGKKPRAKTETTLSPPVLNKPEEEGFSLHEPESNRNYETEGPMVAAIDNE